MSKKTIPLIFFLIFIINICLLCWYVIHNDINFGSDIARDFFILQEIAVKKFVLIGPNSSTGLFHGPLWAYLNFPAFLIGHGSPVIVGWFWVFLAGLFSLSSYFIAKHLFNKTVGYLYALMVSLYMFFHVHTLFNPHGAMFFIPVFFFLFIRYIETKKWPYLFLHILATGALIQFQMAVGIPFFLLSSAAVIFEIIKTIKWIHLSNYLLFPITIANFIIFDFRHQHLLLKILFRYLNSPKYDHPHYFLLGIERVKMLFTSVEFMRRNIWNSNLILFLLLLVGIYLQLKAKKYRLIYISFLYFYVGFFALSLINTGPLLYFYLFPLFPFVFLIFSSLITHKFSKFFLCIFIFTYIINISTVFADITDSKEIIGKSIYSWNFLYNAAKKIYNDNNKSFGYFVYSPNVLAYEGKYAMLYTQREFPNFQGKNNVKEKITYLFIAPPPPNNPFMKDEWWRLNKVNLNANPVKVINFQNGYKIEKYFLNKEQITVPVDPNLDPGLFFR